MNWILTKHTRLNPSRGIWTEAEQVGDPFATEQQAKAEVANYKRVLEALGFSCSAINQHGDWYEFRKGDEHFALTCGQPKETFGKAGVV